MKAIRLHKTGGPEVFQLDAEPTPEAGPAQVEALNSAPKP
jgi:hypothetical protein